MANIPIYNQQVAPPHKPRDTTAGAQWGAVAQVGKQVEQIGSAFAGKLFDLAAQNERNQAVVTARDRWRTFWSDLQKDPEYTTYGEKLDSFFKNLQSEVEKGQRLPRAKRETGQLLQDMRGDWADAVQKLSDQRTIDHSRTVRIEAINQAVADLDINRLMGELKESQATMEFTEEDLAKMKETGIREIISAKTMDYARMMGDAGMQWLMSDEAMAKFEFEVSPEEKYFLDADTRNQMAVQLSQERTNRLKAAEIADFQRKRLVMDFVRGEIAAKRLTRADQLYDEEYQKKFQEQYGMPMGLNDQDREAISTILSDRAEAIEKDREGYSDELLQIVKDAVEAGDAETAERYLAELIEGGYGIDSMGRPDPEVRRYMEQLGRIQSGEGLTAFDKDANAMRAKLRAGTLSRKDLADFLEKHPDKEGRLEHDKMWNELQQQEREAQEKASKKSAESEEMLLADYVTRFWRIYGAEGVREDELVKLHQWLYKNYPRNEFDRNMPGIPESDFVNWGKLINAKIEDMRKDASGLHAKKKQMGEDRIRDYWSNRLKPLEGATGGRQLQNLGKLQNERDRMLLDYLEMAKNEQLDPVDEAQNLINQAARIEVDSLYGPDYKKPGVIVEPQVAMPGSSPLADYALGTAGAGATPRKAEPVSTPELAGAKQTLLQFSNYAKDENGLIIRRNKKTGELSLFDTRTQQWVKTDEARLTEYSAAAGTVKKYE